MTTMEETNVTKNAKYDACANDPFGLFIEPQADTDIFADMEKSSAVKNTEPHDWVAYNDPFGLSCNPPTTFERNSLAFEKALDEVISSLDGVSTAVEDLSKTFTDLHETQEAMASTVAEYYDTQKQLKSEALSLLMCCI